MIRRPPRSTLSPPLSPSTPLCRAFLVRQALSIVANQPERQALLHARIRHAETRLAALGLPSSGSQILPVVIGDNARTMRVAGAMQAAGFDIRGIRPPTVPHGTARLRLAITLNVQESDIRSEEHTSELQSLMRISYAVFCLKKTQKH